MQKGFSVVEGLMVLALMGVLLAMAAPGMTAWLGRTQVEALAQAFVRDVRWARTEAIKRSLRVSLCSSADARQCDAQGWAAGWVVFADDNGNGWIDSGDEILRVQSRMTGVASMASTQPANDRLQLTFQSQGVARAAAQSLWLTDTTRTQQRLVCVSMQGRAALRPPGDLACD